MSDQISKQSEGNEIKPGQESGADSSKTFIQQLLQNPTETGEILNIWSGKIKNQFTAELDRLKINGTDKPGSKKNGTFAGSEKDTYVTYKDGLEQKLRFKGGSEVIITRDNPSDLGEIT